MRSLTLLCALFTAGLLPALADTIYSDTNTSSGASVRVADASNNYYVGAMSFATGDTDYSITDVTVNLYINQSFGAVNSFYLFSDNGGQPGTNLGLLATVADSTLLDYSDQWVDLGDPNLAVNADTQYWVVDQYDVAQSQGVQEIFWNMNGNTTNTTGVIGQEMESASGSGWAFKGGYAMMTITGSDLPVSTPEPGTLVFAGIGMVCIGAKGWRRRA